MKIAIIAPSPVPFSVGGAEKLWWGLQEFIHKQTSYQCELIKIPILEDSFWNLIGAYYTFYKLDLSHFDLVISGKYPAWMVKHDNHYLYMLHTLRGLYDTYHVFNLPLEFISSNEQVNRVLDFIDQDERDLNLFFELLFALKESNDIAEDTFAFPGPFIRKIIHFLDKKAMQNVSKFFAISKTVANREEYFPKNTKVKVVYPPSNLTDFYSENYSYFFTVSRLDSAKRVNLLLKAYLKSDSKIGLKIAGMGPMESELKELAKEDKRVEFLGFVSDKELIDLYANAYAVIFTPCDEDYGLVTIEAMRSKKPVITLNDSGGVCEFVKDQETGLLCKPSKKALSEAITYLSEDRTLTEKMGEQAQKEVAFIDWSYTMGSILGQSFEKEKLKKITVITTYPIYPPRGGGQNRIFYLYKEIAKSIRVVLITLTEVSEKGMTKEIAPNLFEIRVPKSKGHNEKEQALAKKASIPVSDIAMMYCYEDTPELVEALQSSAKTSDFVICSHPYTYEMVKKYTDKPIIHESHNVEYLLKKQMLPENKDTKKMLEKLYDVEKMAAKESKYTLVCADDDAKTMNEMYGLDLTKVIEVPNGVDLESVNFTSFAKRKILKNKLGYQEKNIALFMGSWHQPNIDAVEEIFDMADRLPNTKFMILGSVGGYYRGKYKPDNVEFTGIVSDDEKDFILSISDIALNPMQTGSGTNLKMLDYMAAGVPIVSTKVGARGLNIPGDLIKICEVEYFYRFIENIEMYVDIEKARVFVEQKYSWTIISQNLYKSLNIWF